jgi:hypothetical protein
MAIFGMSAHRHELFHIKDFRRHTLILALDAFMDTVQVFICFGTQLRQNQPKSTLFIFSFSLGSFTADHNPECHLKDKVNSVSTSNY